MTSPTRLVILGKQGAGKGTQCVRLSHHYVVPHISTGDMLRLAARAGTEFGKVANQFMEGGELVPDDVITGVVSERLAEPDARARGFILDGFPRTTAQAEALARNLAPDELDLVIYLEVPTELVLVRLASRRVCSVCGANYSLASPPRRDWICDSCGGEVIQREDDTEAAIQRRLDLYEAQTTPLIDFYATQGKLTVISGLGDPNNVMERIVEALDETREITKKNR